MSAQAPSAALLIRPHHFQPNAQTLADNAFQSAAIEAPSAVAESAYREVSLLAEVLREEGIVVHLFEDEERTRPDSVFPNNWLSTHSGGTVVTYPMFARNRRHERRSDIVDALKTHYRVADVIDYSGLEQDEIFLEGTGAMVLDHVGRIAYTARSRRADPAGLYRFCGQNGYEPVLFDAVDGTETPIYHTNVMMAVATEFALIGLESIRDRAERAAVEQRLAAGHDVIPLTNAQVHEFAGNAIELAGTRGGVLLMSARAAAALTRDQRTRIERSARIVTVAVPTIELAGGSVRCMIAGIHLSPRTVSAASTVR